MADLSGGRKCVIKPSIALSPQSKMILLLIGDIENNAESRKREEGGWGRYKGKRTRSTQQPAASARTRTDPFPQLKTETGNWKAKPHLEGESMGAFSGRGARADNDRAEAKHESAAQ